MAKIYDLEKEKQKAKDRAKESPPPIICLRSKNGKVRVYPRWEKGPDGEWHIMHLDSIKAMLGYDRVETDKEGEPEGS
jgi:hypothetical protein